MTTSEIPAFKELLRHYRHAAGLSQEALAERAGLSVDAVELLERGRRTTPRAETVARLVEALSLASPDRAAFIGAATQTLAPAMAPSRPSMSLPAPPTVLIGREQEVEAVVSLLRRGDVRLLTLTGLGGVGKTRLALAVAHAVQDAYPDGVVFVDLSPLHDATLVAATVAQALGLRETGGLSARELLLAHLRAQRLLLVLDNLEHLLDAVPLVSELLERCFLLTVLATSRTALHIRAEQQFRVKPLAAPAADRSPSAEDMAGSAAVQLFAARARMVQPDFRLASDNAEAVARVCRRLDGLPLAIELAAAWMKLLTPAMLLARLERRLPLLRAGSHDLPARLQTMRGAVAWSYELLDADERALFRRLAVFVGGCTLEAAEGICRVDGEFDVDVLEGLISLVDKSLLNPEEQAQDEPRVGMLETVREYAVECLAASEDLPIMRRRHAAYFLALAETAEPELWGPTQGAWLERLERDHANLRAVLFWAQEHGEAELGLRLAAALWQFWYVRGHVSEGRAWLDALLTGAASDDRAPAASVRARALLCACTLATEQADYERAAALCDESSALCRESGDVWGVAWALNVRAVMARQQGDHERAIAHYEESLTLFRRLGDQRASAIVLNNRGALARYQGDYERARALYDEALTLKRAAGDNWGIAMLLDNLGELARDQGDYTRAATLSEESLAVRRTLGDKRGIAAALLNLASVARAHGDYARARDLYEESLTLCWEVGERSRIATCLEGLAGAVGALGRAEDAARLLGAAAALRDRIGAPLPSADQADYERTVSTTRAALGDGVFARAWAEGQALSLEQAVARVLNSE